jgi:hypothetical protein
MARKLLVCASLLLLACVHDVGATVTRPLIVDEARVDRVLAYWAGSPLTAEVVRVIVAVGPSIRRSLVGGW